MCANVQFSEAIEAEVDAQHYRALSPAAMTCLFLALLSVCSLLSVYLLVIPVLGLLVGIYALVQIKQRPAELTGRGFAITGITVSCILFVLSLCYAAYVYATEVPEGYRRIFYSQLQPEEGKIDQLVPPLTEDLDGEQVFIKGYIFPGPQQQGLPGARP